MCWQILSETDILSPPGEFSSTFSIFSRAIKRLNIAKNYLIAMISPSVCFCSNANHQVADHFTLTEKNSKQLRLLGTVTKSPLTYVVHIILHAWLAYLSSSRVYPCSVGWYLNIIWILQGTLCQDMLITSYYLMTIVDLSILSESSHLSSSFQWLTHPT